MSQDEHAILIVDDDEEYLEYMRSAVAQAGHARVVAAASGEAALERLKKGPVALVVADLRLGSMSGLDVLAAARRAQPLSVGIIMTANGSLDSALSALEQGAYDYLIKPCSLDVAQTSVRRGLEHYRLRRELMRRTAQFETLQSEYQGAAKLLEGLSHRLRNPLTVIYGYAAQLSDGDEAKAVPPELRTALESIYRNARMMKDAIEQILGLRAKRPPEGSPEP